MISKDWTVQDALGFLRVLTSQLDPTKVGNNFAIDALHSSLSEVMQYLSVVKIFDFGIKTTLAVTVSGKYGTASLSAFTTNPINGIVKIVDPAQVVNKRLCIERTQKQFDNLKNIIQETTGTIFWARNGNDINFYSGDLTISPTLDFYYIAYPKKVSSLTDYLETRDTLMGLVLAKTKLKFYEILNSQAPESLNQGVNTQIANLRKSNLEDQKSN